jgi:UDP-glucose 4-epimerase
VAAFQEAGHDVRATDLTPPLFERPEEGEADYVQADLSDAGDAFAVVRSAFDCVWRVYDYGGDTFCL